VRGFGARPRRGEPGPELSAQRAARNEAYFREHNRRLDPSAGDGTSGRSPFLCECEDATCTQVLLLTPVEYASIRAGGRRFAVAPGHVGAHGRVVAEHDAYTVVEPPAPTGMQAGREVRTP
jgi:hypothetical protein